MIDCESLKNLSKDTSHLPDSSFYLWYADILIREVDKEIIKYTTRDRRCNLILQVEGYLSYAIQLFDWDKKYYTDVQKKWFLEKKIKVCENIKKVQIKSVKLLIKELNVV
jgi:hypothetical protein